jgi:hypothetical protein
MVRLHACFGVLLLVGCGQSTAPAQVEKKSARPNIAIEVTPAPVPARYAAPLPHTLAGLEAFMNGDPAQPPRAHVVDNILLGDAVWLQRFELAAAKVSRAETAPYIERWSHLFEQIMGSADFCASVRPIVTGAPGTARAALLTPFVLDGCATSADASLVLRDDTPSSVVVKFYDPWSSLIVGQRGLKFHPRLAQAAREVIEKDDEYHIASRIAAATLTRLKDPAADAALLAIHKDIRDPARATQVAFAFANSKNAEGLALFRAACQREPADAICKPDTRKWLDNAETSIDTPERQVSAEDARAGLAQLRAMGFEKVARVNPAAVKSIDAETLLLDAGQAYLFDVETDRYPNAHDSLLRQLATLPEPSLHDAVFEEVAPGSEEESEPYRLIAYANGRRYATEALNLGDWYDVDAVLRLLNRILEDRKAVARFVPLATGGQTLVIVAAPPEALARASAAKLLDLGVDADAARENGKEFEDAVRERLEKTTRD